MPEMFDELTNGKFACNGLVHWVREIGVSSDRYQTYKVPFVKYAWCDDPLGSSYWAEWEAWFVPDEMQVTCLKCVLR